MQHRGKKYLLKFDPARVKIHITYALVSEYIFSSEEGLQEHVGQKNIIELNGKTYDAVTGALLGESRVKAVPTAHPTTSQRGRTIDGFVRPTTVQQHKTVQPIAAKPTLQHTAKPHTGALHKHMDVQRRPGMSTKPHHPEKPKTLMRRVVKKPETVIKPAIKTTAPSEVMAAPKGTIAKPLEKKMSVTQVNPIRLVRSRRVAKSHHIHRFSQERATQVVTAAVPVVQQQPTPRRSDFSTRPVITRAPAKPTITAPAAAIRVTAPIEPQTVQQKQSAGDIFEAALAHATSHEQTTPRHAKRHTNAHRRAINVFAGFGAFLLIAGFVGYLNLSNIELRVASMRAGIHASMPSYKPTGFARDGGIESSEGRVAINFRSGESIYTITQEASDWNSTTLLDQTTAERGQPTQTVQSKGRTIYIFDKSNATWVNGGVHYQVSGNAALDTNELVELATSM